MINQKMAALGNEPNKIRELFAYGMQRKAEIGAENVFDYSIGNPSVPAPAEVKAAFDEILSADPVKAHEYTPSPGDPAVRQAIAENISKRTGINASAGNVYMTSGASSAIAISLAAISNPGDEVIVLVPYFPEYKTWSENAGCSVIEVMTHVGDFQIDVDAIKNAITERTSAIIINSPNNPAGTIYTRKSLCELAEMLKAKEAEYGHQIFIISDEPYRELTYGAEVTNITELYDDTIVCYTWSKSLSLPGERIGYIYVSDKMKNAADVFLAVCGAGRALGYICASVSLQRVVAKCLDVPADIESYANNRKLLMDGLKDIGYEFVEPEGAFYLWMKALEPDSNAFSERAKDFELLLVPSVSFGMDGWVRLSYCIAEDTIRNSFPALRALKESYDAR